jgi:hypothetical protein
MDRKLIYAIAAISATVLAATSGALGRVATGLTTSGSTGQVLCLSGTQVSGPNSSGQCKSGQTAVTVAAQSEVAPLAAQVSLLQGQVSSLESANAKLSADVSAMQTTLSKVSYSPQGLNGQPTLTITGANLQIANGTGNTDSPNGLGNLILGYDEGAGTQTGSHNVVLGYSQDFTSYGGIMGGWNNVLSGPSSLVFGVANVASGIGSSVTAGFQNTASGFGASVSGGRGNTASNYESSVTGGAANTASGNHASVSGGNGNTASGDQAAILGGNGITVPTTNGTSP